MTTDADQLAVDNLPLAESIARSWWHGLTPFRKSQFPLDDIYGVARLATIEACRSFRSDGTTIGGWIRLLVRQAIERHLGVVVSLADFYVAERTETVWYVPEQRGDDQMADHRRRLHEAVSQLSREDRLLVQRRYGIGVLGNAGGRTRILDRFAIAKRMGLSPDQVGHRLSVVGKKIRRMLREEE